MFGYGGKILRVNLTDGCVRQEEYSEAFARTYLGGNGFAAKLIYDSVPADAGPWSQTLEHQKQRFSRL